MKLISSKIGLLAINLWNYYIFITSLYNFIVSYIYINAAQTATVLPRPKPPQRQPRLANPKYSTPNSDEDQLKNIVLRNNN